MMEQVDEVRAGVWDGTVAVVYSEYDKTYRVVVGGESGYALTRFVSSEEEMNAFNSRHGVTPLLAEAIMIVSMFPNKKGGR